MELFWIILGSIFILAGLIGAFLPVAPGLPFSYIGLLILQILHSPFTITFMIIWLLVVIIFGFVLDNVIPAWATKKSGGTPYGITGSVIGLNCWHIFPAYRFCGRPIGRSICG
ncbi:MAG: DUF456 family protein [Gracilimonas sp.]|nr:DUF456 family protein [Gracilimonas sp.]